MVVQLEQILGTWRHTNGEIIIDFKSTYPVVQDIVVLPSLVGQIGNLEYSVMPKAHGRYLGDILRSYSPELKRPGFDEFDSYESYVSEIECRFERAGDPMTRGEVKDAFLRFGKALGTLHSQTMDTSESNNSLFLSVIHSDLHDGNVFVSAYGAQLIDNAQLIRFASEKISINEDLISVFETLICFIKPEDQLQRLLDVKEFYYAFFTGYINSFDNKIACAQYLKTSWTTTELSDLYHLCLGIEAPQAVQALLNQLPAIIDSIAGIEICNNNCEDENLLGDIPEGVILTE